jgi:hypothetical protein
MEPSVVKMVFVLACCSFVLPLHQSVFRDVTLSTELASAVPLNVAMLFRSLFAVDHPPKTPRHHHHLSFDGVLHAPRRFRPIIMIDQMVKMVVSPLAMGGDTRVVRRPWRFPRVGWRLRFCDDDRPTDMDLLFIHGLVAQSWTRRSLIRSHWLVVVHGLVVVGTWMMLHR